MTDVARALCKADNEDPDKLEISLVPLFEAGSGCVERAGFYETRAWHKRIRQAEAAIAELAPELVEKILR